MKDHRDDAIQWLMTESSLDKGIAEKVLDEELSFRTADGSISDQDMAALVDIVNRDHGFENTTVEDLKKVIDLSLLPQVQKDMGLAK